MKQEREVFKLRLQHHQAVVAGQLFLSVSLTVPLRMHFLNGFEMLMQYAEIPNLTGQMSIIYLPKILQFGTYFV